MISSSDETREEPVVVVVEVVKDRCLEVFGFEILVSYQELGPAWELLFLLFLLFSLLLLLKLRGLLALVETIEILRDQEVLYER